jgi:hypothetical protein
MARATAPMFSDMWGWASTMPMLSRLILAVILKNFKYISHEPVAVKGEDHGSVLDIKIDKTTMVFQCYFFQNVSEANNFRMVETVYFFGEHVNLYKAM